MRQDTAHRVTAILLTLTGLFATLIFPSYVPAAGLPSGLTDRAVVLPKQSPVIAPHSKEFLTNRDGADEALVWVFFTDKGLPARTSLNGSATSVTFPERTMKRRAKMDLAKVLYIDLPVESEYVSAVSSLGARTHRLSRWLNAASFTMPIALLDRVAELPFVAQIRPVAKFHTEEVNVDPVRNDAPPTALDAQALNYGSSFTQLNQINVPAAHALGYSGKGVTLAIFDTGFRKTHEAFAAHWANGRVLAEHDFVFDDGNTANEPADDPSQWNHGTYIWGTSGGNKDGKIYGPAYEANFILCKTEDIRSETPVEEDNWVAAVEFADSVGADVITSSLTYSAWYTYSDYDGQTATITIAANTADSLGIIVCNAMGNSGPALGTLTPPADAFEILAVGAVTSSGAIASFSSRGPTFDGRPKPEVVAQGVATYASSAASDVGYTSVSGTSLSTPLIAGLCCLVLEANPCFTPQQVREAIMMTADRAANPDSTTYGHGIPDAVAAIDYATCPPSCCVDPTGNINGDPGNVVDVADLTALIDHLFITFAPIPCPEEGNVNGDANGEIDVADLTMLIDHLFISFAPTASCQ